MKKVLFTLLLAATLLATAHTAAAAPNCPTFDVPGATGGKVKIETQSFDGVTCVVSTSDYGKITPSVRAQIGTCLATGSTAGKCTLTGTFLTANPSKDLVAGETGAPADGSTPSPLNGASRDMAALGNQASSALNLECRGSLCLPKVVGDAIDSVGDSTTSWFGQIGMDFIVWILANIFVIIFKISQYALWFSATVFDYVLYYTVLQFGNFANTDATEVLRTTWALVRDLVNLIILGGFVYIAFVMALNIDEVSKNTGASSQGLINLIIAAVLVNFSFFFAGAMIDASNFVTSTIFHSNIFAKICDLSKNGNTLSLAPQTITTPSIIPGQTGSINTPGINQALRGCSIGNAFVNVTKLPTIDGKGLANPSQAPKQGATYMSLLVLSLLGFIMYFTAAGVFLGASFLFVGRFVGLLILLVMSPIGIVGSWVPIPQVKDLAKNWWKAMREYLTFPPLFMIYIMVGFMLLEQVARQLSALDNGQSIATIINAEALASGKIVSQSISLILVYFIGITVLTLALSQARDSAKEAASVKSLGMDKVWGFTNRLADYGNAAMTIPSRVYDNTLGQILARIPGVAMIERNTINPILRQPRDKGFFKTDVPDDKQKTGDQAAKDMRKSVEKFLDPTEARAKREEQLKIGTAGRVAAEEERRRDKAAEDSRIGMYQAQTVIAELPPELQKQHRAELDELQRIVEFERKRELTEAEKARKQQLLKNLEDREAQVLGKIDERIKGLGANLKRLRDDRQKLIERYNDPSIANNETERERLRIEIGKKNNEIEAEEKRNKNEEDKILKKDAKGRTIVERVGDAQKKRKEGAEKAAAARPPKKDEAKPEVKK